MMCSPNVKEEPDAQGTSTVTPGPIKLSQEERQALLSECSEDKCEQARLEFVRETVAQGKDGCSIYPVYYHRRPYRVTGTPAMSDAVFSGATTGLPSPVDWRCTLHLRGSGRNRGKIYTSYQPPNGKCVRSKQAAWVLLGLDTTSGAAQPTSNATTAGTKVAFCLACGHCF